MEKITRNYLEIKSLYALQHKERPSDNYRVERTLQEDFQLNKFFYKQIGKNYHWTDRLQWTDKQWINYVSNPNVFTFVLKEKNNLAGFDTLFRHSQLSTQIDNTESSVLSNITNIKLRKNYSATVDGNKSTIKLDFGNKVYNPHTGHNKASGGVLTTTGFKLSGDDTSYFFDDDGNGNVRRYYADGSTRVYKDNTAGSIDYGTGVISINTLTYSSTLNTDNSIDFTIIPDSNDVISVRNQLLDITASEISVTGVADTVASGETSAGVGYTTSSSYS